MGRRRKEAGFDFRGSTVALTDERGEVVERFGYGPYGELVAGKTSVMPLLFNGRYGVMTDPNGFYFMRAQFYSPEVERLECMRVTTSGVFAGKVLNDFILMNALENFNRDVGQYPAMKAGLNALVSQPPISENKVKKMI